MKLKVALILLGIFILAFLLRVYKLDDYPSGFHRDEVFLGYNAYSILKTGKDISGIFAPVHLKSFLYTPAGYAYFSLPFIILFGLTEFSIRFASAFFGALSIVVIYFLAKNLFSRVKKDKISISPSLAGIISSIFLAISPWHINLSRTASVATLVAFFIMLGTFLFLKWSENRKTSFLLLSFISFGASMTFYVAPYSFLPFFIPVLFLFFANLRNIRKMLPIGVLYFVIIFVPLAITLLSPTLSLRVKSLSIFSNEKASLVVDEKIREDGVVNISILGTRIFHNKPIEYMRQFLENYFSHLSYNFFFTDQGLPERYKIPLVGLLYLFDLPLILAGIWTTAKHGIKIGFFLLVWILLVPVGSALALDDIPNLQRTLFILPAIIMLETVGLLFLLSFVKKGLRNFVFFVAGSAVLVSLIFYLHQYYIHGFVYRPWYRQDGYKELVQNMNKFLPDYKYAVITNRESAPTLFFLFYGKVTPHDFQRETKNATMTDFDRIGFGKYTFSQEECPVKEILDSKTGTVKLSGVKNVLYVNSGLCTVPRGKVKVLSEIKRKDNSVVFRILSLDEQ